MKVMWFVWFSAAVTLVNVFFLYSMILKKLVAISRVFSKMSKMDPSKTA